VILCAIIPLYFLFNIPDKNISELRASKFSVKGQTDRLDSILVICDSLDKSLSEKNLRMEFHFTKLLSAYEHIDKKELYWPLFLKVSTLYQYINKINESDLKIRYTRLKADSARMSADMIQLKADLKSCNDLKDLLIGTKSSK
jgi:hypothetical protein